MAKFLDKKLIVSSVLAAVLSWYVTRTLERKAQENGS